MREKNTVQTNWQPPGGEKIVGKVVPFNLAYGGQRNSENTQSVQESMLRGAEPEICIQRVAKSRLLCPRTKMEPGTDG